MANNSNGYTMDLICSHNQDFEYQAKKKLRNVLGHKGDFDDDRWLCEGVKHFTHGRKFEHTILFRSVKPELKTIMKYYLLTLNHSPSTLYTRIITFNRFVDFINTQYNVIDLRKVNSQMVNEYQWRLVKGSYSANRNYKLAHSVKEFFERMYEYLGMDPLTNLDEHNWIKIECERKKGEEKKEKVLAIEFYLDLDRLFLDYTKQLSTCTQLMYWLLRLIPSRIEEISLMKYDDQLRKFDGKYYLTIPVPKKGDQYYEIEQKMLPMSGDSMVEKHLFHLINKQTELAKSLQNHPDIMDKGFLFTTNGISPARKSTNWLEGTKHSKHLVNIYNMKFNSHLKKIAKLGCKIYDEYGNPKYSELVKHESKIEYLLTSHKFRHRGITDRLDYGMKTHEIMFLSALDTEDTMWDAYHQPSKDTAISLRQVYKPDEFKTDSLIKPIQIETLDFATDDLDESMFEGDASYDDNALDIEIDLYRHTPIITNDGHRLGICHTALNCPHFQKALKCIGCPNNLSSTADANGIEKIEQLILRFKSDMEFYSSKQKNSTMYDIAKSNFEAYSRRLELNINNVSNLVV